MGLGLAALIIRGQHHTDARFDRMEARTDARFDAMEARTDARFDAMGNRVSELEKGQARMEGLLTGYGLPVRRDNPPPSDSD